MELPIITAPSETREMIDVFLGYNHNLRIGDGEFYDMKNLTSSFYPVLSPRKARGTYKEAENPRGLIAKDALCYVDGADFVIGDERVDMGLSSDLPKSLISMGAYVIIMPDKKYINTSQITDFGNIEAAFETTSPVTFTLCTLDGTAYENPTISDTAPQNPANMALWIDTSSSPHRLKQYSAQSAVWTSIATTYIKIASPGIGTLFDTYDSVDIEGIVPSELSDIGSGMTVWGKGDDYIIVVGMLDKVFSQDQPIKITRSMPDMDFIIESENRLWGCRYGENMQGDFVNEIYATKLGDFKNWSSFMGLSTDSYAVSLGSDGAFTGAVTHLGHPIFFKENCMHKIYGNIPANFQIQTTSCRGVQKGSHLSLAIVNEVLYYKSRGAVCAYDGSLPTEISSALSDIPYSDAVAGALGNKYYISMKDENDEFHLFVYDTARGLWHKEDATEITAFCSFRGELYFMEAGTGKIQTAGGSGVWKEDSVSWMAETGIIGTDSPDKKTLSRLNIRMALDHDASAVVFIQYDSCGDWEYVLSSQADKLRSLSLPIKPRRCDHLRLRIEGRGDCKIYSITKTMQEGSDT